MIKKEILIITIIFSLMIPSAFAYINATAPTGIFNVSNSPPPTPYAWTPLTTHYKDQNFTWTQPSDINDNDIRAYVCVTNDTDVDDCSVVNFLTGFNVTSYKFAGTETNWDYKWMANYRTYYLKLTPNDGQDSSANGTANTTIEFNLTDITPALASASSPRGGLVCDIDFDESMGLLTFAATASDADSDNTSFIVCNSSLFSNTSEACIATTSCGSSQNATAGKGCTNINLGHPGTGAPQTAYAFTCDCVVNDSACPSQCNTTGVPITYYVNQQPPQPSISFTGGTNGDDSALCSGTDTYGSGDTGAAALGSTVASISGSGCSGNSCSENNFIACASLSCTTSATDNCGVPGASTNFDSKIVGNLAPATSSSQIQDGATNFVVLTGNTAKTHADKPIFRTTVSDADITDGSGQIVTVRINVSAISSGASEFGSYTNTTTSNGVLYLPILTELNYSGKTKLYYISVQVSDNAACGNTIGTTEFFTFNLTNNLPYINVLNTTITHTQTPTVSWSITDGDDGSNGNWPNDTAFNNHVNVIDAANGTIYYSYDGTSINNSQLIGTLPWGTPGSIFANRTINFTVWIEDGHSGTIVQYHPQSADAVNTTKQFTLYDFLPDVTNVELTDVGSSYSSCTTATCALSPIEHINSTIAVRVTVNDTDLDCESGTNSNATIYLCLNTSVCNPSIQNYAWNIDAKSRTDSLCTYVFSVNKTSAIEFFRVPNNYKFYVNVSGQGGQRSSDAEMTGSWTYNTLKAINYSTIVYLGGTGSVNLGQWNDGANLAVMTNWGNHPLNLSWNASNPTSGNDTWNLNGTDMQIDDDISHTNEASGFIAPTYLDSTLRYFEPVTGLEVCSAADCSNAALNETLDTYYHIFPPIGLLAGTYNNTIAIVLS